MLGSAVDVAVVERLIAVLGPEDSHLQALLDTHRAHAELLLARMERAARHQDLEALRVDAHSLRGAGATLGARTVALLCSRLEKGDVPPAEQGAAVGALAVEHRRFCTEIEAILQERAAGACRPRPRGGS